MAGQDWNATEIEATVDAYFRLLDAELKNTPLTKSAQNARVRETVQRTKGAVEFKFQNVSAVLRDLHVYWVKGYKPRGNYQAALRDAVIDRLEADSALEQLMLERVTAPLPVGMTNDIQWDLVSPPHVALTLPFGNQARRAVRRDYVAIEAQRRDLGLAGEQAVVQLEIDNLERKGLGQLARKVRHVSLLDGDGLGYDVLSFTPAGEEKYVEVKTTREGVDWPFMITRNEVEFSAEFATRYHLYRVFNFDSRYRETAQVGLYTLPGPVAESCDLNPEVFRGAPR